MEQSPKRSSIALWTAFGLASAATVFDAISSWQIISVNPIALEGNPIWSSLAELIGFGGAMVIRALVGLLLLGVLMAVALRSKRRRVRRIGSFGVYLSAAVLTVLTAYHLIFRFLYS